MIYNLITDQNLRNAIPHMKKKIFQEGQYIYDEINQNLIINLGIHLDFTICEFMVVEI